MSNAVTDSIAIIGMAGRFPQEADSVSNFWKLLCKGGSARSKIPPDRFSIDGFYSPDTERLDTFNTQYGHFLAEDLDRFDAPFFGISPAEAAAMDPQQRSLLECTYHALENAGLSMESVAGTATSVFIAAMGAKDYDFITARDLDCQSKYRATGGGSAFFANRISHFFDLHGSSMFLDTACSGSFQAIHLACQSIRAGESKMSIVGASSVIITPETFMIPCSNAGFLSPDGICYSFDHRANGYARGEGFATIILKPLEQAIQDGDMIRAVIRGTGVNAGGRTPSITQPSAKAQKDLIRQTYASAGCDLKCTQFFEAHGTGTRVGDPIEAQVISELFAGPSGQPVIVGAVKSNIGHLEAASGLASIIKCVLMLESGSIPPNIWFNKLNPDIAATNLKIPTRFEEWPVRGLRRASLNNFGYGGSNGHVILDDALHFLSEHGLRGQHSTLPTPLERVSDGEKNPNCMEKSKLVNGDDMSFSAYEDIQTSSRVLILSAADEQGPKRQAQALENHLQGLRSNLDRDYLDRLIYTLNHRRTFLPWRSYFVVDSTRDLLSDFHNHISQPVRSSSKVDVIFVFTGQGAQWPGMGRDLLDYKVFRQSIEAADQHLESLGNSWSLMEMIRQGSGPQIHTPQYAQPLTAALQVALVDLLRAWNVNPCCVIGHSSGEIAAAYSAARISRQYAWSLAFSRGQVSALNDEDSSRTQCQGMLAVMLPASECQQYISTRGFDGEIYIGCMNSAENTTLTGLKSSLERLMDILQQDGAAAKMLSVTRAYHSPFMGRAGILYRQHLLSLNTSARPCNERPTIPMYSSVSGLQGVSFGDPEYWVRNLTSIVDFSSAVSAALEQGARSMTTCLFIEVGPHTALKRAVQDSMISSVGFRTVEYLHTLERGILGTRALLTLAGKLRTKGHNIALDVVNNLQGKRSGQITLVDLPVYDFDHSEKHWLESKRSQMIRSQGRKRFGFLGRRDIEWNSLWPRWIYVVKAVEEPWVLDHGFGDCPVYPAAGSLVMAIEAARQLVNNDDQISGYRLKEVFFPKSISFDNPEKVVEISIVLKSQAGAINLAQPWFEFQIFHLRNEESIEVCHGYIQAESQSKYVLPLGRLADGDSHWLARSKEKYRSIAARCDQKVHHDQFYENLDHMGFQYGPTFRLLRSMRYNMSGEGLATIKPRASHLATDEKCVIHPAALDAFIHSALVGCSQGSWKPLPPMMAWKTTDMWISTTLLQFTDEQSLELASTNIFTGYREQDCDIIAVDSDTHAPLIISRAQRAVALSSFEEASLKYDLDDKRLAYTMQWRPDLSIASPDMVQTFLEKETISFETRTKEAVDDCERQIIRYIIAMLAVIPQVRHEDFRSPYDKYFKWMYEVVQSKRPRLVSVVKEPIEQRVHDKNTIVNPAVEAIRRVGNSLESIFYGETAPLDILFRDDLAESVYRFMWDGSAKKIALYLENLTHKNSHLNILEIGAGTGSITGTILDTMAFALDMECTALPCSKYTFTDVSSNFFEKAEKRFSKYADKLDFRRLDISLDPQRQGFERNSYDVVIAAAVLHGTSDLCATLRRVRRLVKPGGKLILLEICGEEVLSPTFVFGILPGWWYGTESFRPHGALVNEGKWDDLLRSTGFSGIDVVLRDFEDPQYHQTSVMISSADEEPRRMETFGHTTIIVDHGNAIQASVASNLQAALDKIGAVACPTSLKESRVVDLDKENVICLLDLTSDTLQDMDDATFMELQRMFMKARRGIWATVGAGLECTNPSLAKVEGMVNSINSERGDSIFAVVSFADEKSLEGAGSKLAKVAQQMLLSGMSERETGYKEKNGFLGVMRVKPHTQTSNLVMEACVGSHHRTSELTGTGTRAHKNAYLEIGAPGALESLHFRSGSEGPAIADDDIEVDVFAAGLVFKDLLIALGQVPSTYIGSEAAGVVRKKGSAATFDIGDRVVCCSSRAIRTVLRCKCSEAHKIPDSMPFEVAASLPVAFATAHHALFTVARLREHETILIHAGAGAVGQAAIQLARLLGATVISTAGSTKKRQFLTNNYNIPNTHLFSSRNTSFVEGIKGITRERGVDVVLNCLAGELFYASCEVLAPLGRFVEIGKKDILANNHLGMKIFARGATFSAVDLAVLRDEAREDLNEIVREALRLVFQKPKVLHEPKPVHLHKASEAEKAFRAFQSCADPGKHVLTFEPDEPLEVQHPVDYAWDFDPNALYVVAGGFGGIGRSVIYWMFSRGARRFLILSRSGVGNRKDCRQLVAYLQERGAQVRTPSCDIADAGKLVRILSQTIQELGPIKGCIQASMATRDMYFDKMSRKDFQHTFPAKVTGSWNLHTLLPQNLDFFILFSSLAGELGNRGVSNYAAANTYQDALARYRVSRGQKGVSLNLGLLVDVGYVAENYDICASYKRAGFQPVRVQQLLGILEILCDPAYPLPRTPDHSQLLVGLPTQQGLRNRGHEPMWFMARPTFHNLELESYPDAQAYRYNSNVQEIAYLKLLKAAESTESAVRVMVDGLKKKLSKAVGISEDNVDANMPLHAIGVDSLIAVEVRYWFMKNFGAEVAVNQVLKDQPAIVLCREVAGTVRSMT